MRQAMRLAIVGVTSSRLLQIKIINAKLVRL